MAYLGRQPIVGNYQVLDALTATTTDTYALTKGSVAVYPQTPANCIVSLNGVIQAPYNSYTISGSNIVFASALTGSDSIDFITVLGDVLNVGTVSDGTITTAKLADSSVSLAKLTATGTKDATTFLRGDNTFASAGGANTPNFFVRGNGTGFSLNAGSHTKVTSWTTPEFDTASAWSDNKFTIPSGENGKYCVSASVYFNYTGSAKRFQMSIRVNGSPSALSTISATYNNSANVCYTRNFSVGDYIEIYAYHDQVNSSAYTTGSDSVMTFLSIYKIIE